MSWPGASVSNNLPIVRASARDLQRSRRPQHMLVLTAFIDSANSHQRYVLTQIAKCVSPRQQVPLVSKPAAAWIMQVRDL
jgi:hypothetical protein